MPTRDLTKITAGPCSVTLATTGDLGHTQEGVEFNYEPDIRERMVDQYGTTVVELVLVGESIEVTMRITQWELANFKVAIPAGLDGTSYLGIGRKPGFELASNVGEQLTIHPLENVGDDSEDLILWKAVANSPVAIGYNNEGDRIFEVTFKAVVDTTRVDGKTLGQIGAV